MLQHRLGERTYVVDGRRKAALVEGSGSGAERQRLAGAWTRTPGYVLVGFGMSLAGARGAHQPEDRLDDAFGNRHAPDQVLDLLQLCGGEYVLGPCLLRAGRLDQDAPLRLQLRIGDIDL